MSFEFKETNIKDLLVITPHIYEDNRGIYRKFYEKDIFLLNGINDDFFESSDIYSKKGVLRGLHYQLGNSQSKLIRVLSGKVYDVAVDLRPDSDTFGEYHAELLVGDDNKELYIPRGFAHGFIVLEDDTIFSYQCAGKYEPDKCGGIVWDDVYLNISWPLKEYNITNVIMTDKDKNWPNFEQIKQKLI